MNYCSKRKISVGHTIYLHDEDIEVKITDIFTNNVGEPISAVASRPDGRWMSLDLRLLDLSPKVIN